MHSREASASDELFDRREFLGRVSSLVAASILADGVLESLPAEAEGSNLTKAPLKEILHPLTPTLSREITELSKLDPIKEVATVRNLYAIILSIRDINDPRIHVSRQRIGDARVSFSLADWMLSHTKPWASPPSNPEIPRPLRIGGTKRGDWNLPWVATGTPSDMKIGLLDLVEFDSENNVTCFMNLTGAYGTAHPAHHRLCTIPVTRP